MRTLSWPVTALLIVCLCSPVIVHSLSEKSDSPNRQNETEPRSTAPPLKSLIVDSGDTRPLEWPAGIRPKGKPGLSPGVEPVSVPAVIRSPEARYIQSGVRPPGPITPAELPTPSITPHPGSGKVLVYDHKTGTWTPKAAPVLSTDFDSIDFDDDGSNNMGLFHIPADPHGAAGPNHVVNVVNTSLAFHQKNGTSDFEDALEDFFLDESPASVFDPKVLFDQYEGRFLIVVLDQTDSAEGGGATDTSFILLAVSDDSDPNGTWFTTKIDSKINIEGTDHWADYPGFVVDEEAIYITNNMFEFAADGGTFGGARLWVVDKDGFYSGGTVSVSVFDPYDGGANGIETTTQPAHLYGSDISGVGTFLISYSGIRNGFGDDFVQVVRMDSPLGTPTFDQAFVAIGDVDDSGSTGDPGASMPLAPQSGTGDLVETNDRRALDAVWYDDSVWMTTTIVPNSGDPDAGEATAYWVQIDTTLLDPLAIADQGAIGGETIASASYTSFPSVAVNGAGHTAIGFSGSASTIFPGAFYTTRQSTDSAGFTEPPGTLRTGTDFYVRRFCGARNRWGDYSGMSVDPGTGCFWVYNKYAITRGLGIDCDDPPDGSDDEDGKWGTAFGEICPTGACPVDMVLADLTLNSTESRKSAWSINALDDVVIGASGIVDFISGDHVSMGPGFTVQAGGAFKVTLSATPCS